MDKKQHKTPGVFVSHSKCMDPDDEPYYRLLENGRSLGPKIAVILHAVKEIFYKRMPLEKITLDKLAGACDYYLSEERSGINMSPFAQSAPASVAPVPEDITDETPQANRTSPEIAERNMDLDPESLKRDYEKIPKEDLAFLFGDD